MTTIKTKYLEERIRDGYTSEDVRMWQALCELAKTEVGPSVQHLWTIIDIAKNTHCDVLDVVKTGRTVSEQKNINEKFMRALFMAVCSDGEDSEGNPAATSSEHERGGDEHRLEQTRKAKILDLTCDEELSDSGSYEEESCRDGPDSATCYAIDDEVGVVASSSKGVKRKLKFVNEFDTAEYKALEEAQRDDF